MALPLLQRRYRSPERYVLPTPPKVIPFERVNPPLTLRLLEGEQNVYLESLRSQLTSATVEDLVSLNAHWFRHPTGMREAVAMLWLINTKLTVMGVAPAWRKIPAHIKVTPPPPMPFSDIAVRSLSDSTRRNLIRRWVDLEWLRSVLGSSHAPQRTMWKEAFSTDDEEAERAWARINAVQSNGGGKFGPETPYKVIYGLSVPKLTRFGLAGLIDRDAGELLTNARMRVHQRIRPKMEALSSRARRPLTKAEVEQRLVACEALEVAQGRPSDAATVFGWMTGTPITRQSMHAMRERIADQCKLSTRAWRAPVPRGRSSAASPPTGGGGFLRRGSFINH